MQVASVSTSSGTVRSKIDGWSFEDPNLLVKAPRSSDGKILIGYTPAPLGIPLYTCVLEMLAEGWELLGPPQHEKWEHDGRHHEAWEWWLQRGSPTPPPYSR